MSSHRHLLGPPRFGLTVERIARHLHECYGDFTDTCIVGIQPRGSVFAERLYTRLRPHAETLLFGKLDITFFRDDFRIGPKPLRPDPMVMPFSTEGKRVILVDDVLYTGRTISAALSALQSLGRPREVELVVMVERRFQRELPIAPDYLGLSIDALDEAYVRVRWCEVDGRDEVVLYPNKAASKA